jgi:hypothetical protein
MRRPPIGLAILRVFMMGFFGLAGWATYLSLTCGGTIQAHPTAAEVKEAIKAYPRCSWVFRRYYDRQERS